MTATGTAASFDRYAQIGNLAVFVRRLLERIWTPLLAVLVGETVVLFFTASPGAPAFALVSLGTVIIFAVWRKSGIGLPLVPLIAVQHLIVYGLPIVTGHEVLGKYSETFITDAGIEVLVFSCTLAIVWSTTMRMFRPASPASYALADFQQGGSAKLRRLGLNFIVAGTAYQVLERTNLLDSIFEVLPTGTWSLVVPLVTGISSCGFFLVSLFVSSKQINRSQQIIFWVMLVLSVVISASSFLLSGATTMLAAVLIGLFWGTGRVPWPFIMVTVLLLAFLNIGKFTMRDRYWQFDDDSPDTISYGIGQIPAIYRDWAEASFEDLISPADSHPGYVGKTDNATNGQSLFERINNLQSLLFIIDAIEDQHYTPLDGASYALIPPLLVPRIMWPEKPRTHEGQVLLNVHFGRQDLNSTFKTYVAWGLLPEAYGNFGPLAGAVILGSVMAICFSWLENFTARKLLLSLEGFVSFALILGIASSFEMVASVLITTLFQSVIPIIFGSMPFLRRAKVTRPDNSPA